MRVRYERRDPRPEDLREISELRNRVEQQERDLHKLTERLREFQLNDQNSENGVVQLLPHKKMKNSPRKNSLPEKVIKYRPDVIMEEAELENSNENLQQIPAAVDTTIPKFPAHEAIARRNSS